MNFIFSFSRPSQKDNELPSHVAGPLTKEEEYTALKKNSCTIRNQICNEKKTLPLRLAQRQAKKACILSTT